MLEIRLLGQFNLLLDGVAVKLASRPAQALLAYLVLNAGKPQRRERLAGLHWPEATEDNARTYLRQALWRIRKAIGEEHLLADRMTITFNSEENCWLDVDVLQNERPEGWTADNLISAVTVYEGDLLPGFYDDWVMLERERYQAIYNQRMEALINDLKTQSRWEELLVWGERWIAMGHAPEPAYRGLMRAHYELADLTSMTAVYRRCVEMLRTELGVEPSEETQTLFQHLSRRREASAETPHPAADAAIFSSPIPEEQQYLPAFITEERALAPLPSEPFIGREKELNFLDWHLQVAREGRGRMVFITGEIGQGKTTLLYEFARRAQDTHPELIVAIGACPVYTPICAPYGLFREVLEMLTGNVESAWAAGIVNREQALRLWRLLPQIVDNLLQYGPHLLQSLVSTEGLITRAISAAIDAEQIERLKAIAARSRNDDRQLSKQDHFFAEYADFLVAQSKRQPLLIILDDLHWADSSSIGLLGHLGHRLPESAILLVGAYRPEEVNQGRVDGPHPLLPVLSEYKRRLGQVLVSLDEPEAASRRAFIDALLDEEANALDEEFRQALTRHTNGHPLFTVELLRAMQERGALLRDDTGRWVAGPDFDWKVLPPRVEGVIETRINHLDHELRRWLDLACVEGDTFTAEVIAQVLTIEAHLVVERLSKELDRKNRLVTAQGIRPVGTRRLSLYQFRHSLFRHYLYNQLDDVEHSYLHQQVGEALEQLFEGRTEEIADQLAHHYQRAGLPEKTMIFLQQAGDNAARVYAYEEARDFYEQALTLARQHNEDGRYNEALIDLFTKLGRTLEHYSDMEGALNVYQEMEALGEAQADQSMTLLSLVAQGTLHSIPSPVHDPKQGQAISKQALILSQELDDRSAEARALWNLMIACEYDNQLANAIKFGERSLVLARELKIRRQVAFTLNDLAGCYWVGGQIARAKELFQEAADIWREFDNRPMLADVLFSYSLASMFGGDYDEAIALSDESWQLSQSISNQWGLAMSRSRIGFVHRARGEPGRGIAAMNEGLRLGEVQDLPIPQIVTGAELAFDYACLGVTDLGLETARKALLIANEKGPSHRPYLLAALAKNHLVKGDLEQTEKVIHQAKTDAYWQAFPVYCLALDLVDCQLALSRADYEKVWQLGGELLDQLRQFGVRSYLPELLDLIGQVLFKLDRLEEARAHFLEARSEAEAMNARGNLWPILFHLSQLEAEPEEAQSLRQKALEIIEFIANNTGNPAFRESFLSLPEAQALVGATQ